MKSVLISTRPQWCDIIGYENEYQINQFGEIRTLKNSSKRKKYDILKPQINSKNGYVYQMLYKNGKGKLWRVHRLVAMIFLPNPYNLPQVNHKNGDKTDNRVENLEWCSQEQNMIHAFKTELEKPSEKQNEFIREQTITENESRERMRREFSANVSHELKTPLTSICGYAEIMKTGVAKPEDMVRFSEIIYLEATRMITLVDDIIKK